jgi:hypothetical protein
MRTLNCAVALAVALTFGLCVPRAAAADAKLEPPVKLIAYYFHITERCVTCLSMERQTKQAIESGFPGELKAKVIEWRPVDVQQPLYRHFIQTFRLHSPSVVLVKVRGGKNQEWRNLDKVWALVNKKADFARYVQDNVRNYLVN